MSDQFIAHYQITGEVGVGGMGVVYRAIDTKLNREVAIKVLTAGFSGDAERLARFRQESKLLASLNHPNVLTIHEAGIHDGAPYLVTELLEGQSLRQRLDEQGRDKSLSAKMTVKLARQIADGLSAAHSKGVIHRDLKPENLFVTLDDRVKILDFGLAKPFSTEEGEAASESESESCDEAVDTLSATDMVRTENGRVLGTPAYMAPEQIKGEQTDQRTDLFALGCVLYEMFTGRRAFKRGSTIETLSAILTEDLSEQNLRDDAESPALDRIIRRCLEKQASSRFQTADDLSFALLNALETPVASPDGERALVARRNRFHWIPWGVSGVSVLLALSMWLSDRGKGDFSSQPSRGALRKLGVYLSATSDGQSNLELHELRIAPDGMKVLYTNDEGLWVSRLDQLSDSIRLKSHRVHGPMWSPDSNHIAFFDENLLYRVEIGGGEPRLITELDQGLSSMFCRGAWLLDNQIVFPGWQAGLYQVAAGGGDAREIVPRVEGERQFGRTMALPHESGVVFSVFGEMGMARIDVWSHERGRKVLLELEEGIIEDPVYSPSGHILYSRSDDNTNLWAFEFSLNDRTRTSEPFRVSAGLDSSLSNDGTLMVSLASPPFHELVWVDQNGEIQGTIGRPLKRLGYGRVSPDGNYIAASAMANRWGWHLWLINISQNTSQLLSKTLDTELDPFWYPDSRDILFRRWSNGTVNAIRRSVFESGPGNELAQQFPIQLTQSGNVMLFVDVSSEKREHGYLRLSQSERPQILFPKAFIEVNEPMLSPDEKLLAYFSDETQQRELYLVDFPGFERKEIVSTGGASSSAVWHPDGSELFFICADKKSMMSVSVSQDQGLEVSEPNEVFTLPEGVVLPGFDVTQDRRFLMSRMVSAPVFGQPDAMIVQNWIEEFREEKFGE